MLGSFIRLVDYMLVEALVDRTIGSVEEIVAMLEAPRASAEKTHKVGILIACRVGFERHFAIWCTA